jgi:hypothetical protein
MQKRGLLNRLLFTALVGVLLAGCAAPAAQTGQSGTSAPAAQNTPAASVSTPEPDASSGGAPQAEEAAVSSASHAADAEPDYAIVFPQDTVNRIDITLSAESWTALQDEMTAQFGAQGSGEQGGPGQAPPGQGEGNPPPQGLRGREGGPGGSPGGGMGGLNFGDTSYVIGTVSFNGETWNSVGFRYSGNSTLNSSWRSGTDKVSFRLDFDEFEDQDPSTQDQRFYGFKQLSFKSNAKDASYLREKLAGDLFNASGVIAPQTAFYAVYLDSGEGSRYIGLFTAVEIVDDTLIETRFSDDSGNVYKPEGSGAAFAAGTFKPESFEKQTNASEADWSDIEAVFSALHSDLRVNDPAAWRAGLEAVFDVDAFLRWLAVDTLIQNWDTYGGMAHNYYLYTDPGDGLVTWIPWDNNEAFNSRTGGGGGPGSGTRELDLAAVGEQWPLIRYLADDPVYREKYDQYLQETLDKVWQPAELEALYQQYHDLITPYVAQETDDATQLKSLQSFEQSLSALIQHAQDRYTAAQAYLAAR